MSETNETTSLTNTTNAFENVIVEITNDVIDETTDKIITDTNNIVKNTLKNVRDELLSELLEKLRIKLGPVELNGRSLMVAMRYAMEIVEVTKLKGEEQKQMVIRLLRCLVIDAPLSEKKEKLCLQLIDKGVISQSIDLVVDATKGNINVNSAVNMVSNAVVSTNCCGAF